MSRNPNEIRMEVQVSSLTGITTRCLECGASESFPRAAVAAADQWCRKHECQQQPKRLPAPVILGEFTVEPEVAKQIQRGMVPGMSIDGEDVEDADN